jgi:tetratricopeptide (TPR) repeat protein
MCDDDGVVLPPLARLGALLELRGDDAAAETVFRRLVEAGPRGASARNELGNCLQSQHRNQEALAAYLRAAELAPHAGAIACNVGTMLRDAGALEESIAAFKRATVLAPRLVQAHYHLATALLARGMLAFLLFEAGRDEEALRLVDYERYLRVRWSHCRYRRATRTCGGSTGHSRGTCGRTRAWSTSRMVPPPGVAGIPLTS